MNLSLRTNLLTAAIGAALLLGITSVKADPIINWDYTLDSAWTDSTQTSGDGVIRALNDVQELGTGAVFGQDTLEWGEDGGDESSVVVDNPNISGAFTLVDQGGGVWSDTVDGTLLIHNNVSISSAFATLDTAELTDIFRLIPSIAGPITIGTPARTDIFDIDFKETSNDNSCIPEATSNCDDIFVVDIEDFSFTFMLDGYNYTVEITSDELIALSDAACIEAGAATGCFGIITQEGESNNIQFDITLSAEAKKVPEPASLALLGLGLVGLGFIRRKA